MSDTDREILKPLADTLATIADDPIQNDRKKLWADYHALKETDKIPVCITYEGIPAKQWELILGDNFLKCSGELARSIEFQIRKSIWVAENVPDDHPVFAAVGISAVQKRGYDWGVKLEWHKTADSLGAGEIIAPFADTVDLSQLKAAETHVDNDATQERLEQARELIGGVLAVYPRYPALGESPFEYAVEMRGMEKIMYDAVDDPESVLGMMRIITDAIIADHKRREENGWINVAPDPTGTYNMIPYWRHYCSYLPDDFATRKPIIADERPYVSAQSAAGFGPTMYKKFVHDFNCEIAALYTHVNVYYHGCEKLDHKLKYISTLPNLRTQHVSPWSSVEKAVEVYDQTVNLEVHSHPGKVFFGWKKNDMAAEIRGLVDASGGHRMHLNLSDIHSLNGNPATLTAWAAAAQEIAAGRVNPAP